MDEPSGKRWELALGLVDRGEAPVRMGSLTVYRDARGPMADGLVHIEVDCPTGPDRATEAMARSAIASALEQVQQIIASDPRFGGLLDRYGAVYEYVHDDGMGRLGVARSRGEGDLDWCLR